MSYGKFYDIAMGLFELVLDYLCYGIDIGLVEFGFE